MSSGFAAIALDNPKIASNVGGVLRAAHIFGASLVVIAGTRYKRVGTDATKAWKHIPIVETDDVFHGLPYGCIPIAVDILDNACPLPSYQHPANAFYIFGGEDRTLSKKITERCEHKIIIPTKHCLNLAAAVNVVLYDRLAKNMKLQSSHTI